MMTAYVILRDHPLAAISSGPAITVTATAVGTYQKDLASGDSVVAVQAGEQMSERQALGALLIPSGDNIATLTCSMPPTGASSPSARPSSPAFSGSMAGKPLNAPVVGMAP